MFCGCLAIIFSELNHHIECLTFVADIGTFCPKNPVVVVNKELCSEAITLFDRYKKRSKEFHAQLLCQGQYFLFIVQNNAHL
jgi:hypothetical protein